MNGRTFGSLYFPNSNSYIPFIVPCEYLNYISIHIVLYHIDVMNFPMPLNNDKKSRQHRLFASTEFYEERASQSLSECKPLKYRSRP